MNQSTSLMNIIKAKVASSMMTTIYASARFSALQTGSIDVVGQTKELFPGDQWITCGTRQVEDTGTKCVMISKEPVLDRHACDGPPWPEPEHP